MCARERAFSPLLGFENFRSAPARSWSRLVFKGVRLEKGGGGGKSSQLAKRAFPPARVRELKICSGAVVVPAGFQAGSA